MRKIVLLLISTLFTIHCRAIKADPTPVTITQSDGTQLTVIGHGDEDFSYCTTPDGVILHQVGTCFYIAAIDNDGNTAPTGMLAHNAGMRKAEEIAVINRQDKALFHAKAKAKMMKARIMREPIQNGNRLFPHTGKPKVLVILAEFSDTVFTINSPKEAFEDYLNAEGQLKDFGNRNTKNYGSVRKYFSDMSFGQFEPQFDVYGPVKLEQPLKYYGAGNSDRMDRFIPDVCRAADGIVDFSNYDADNDGYVDLVYVIYAGYGQNTTGNSTECIWPKSGARTFDSEYDGKKLYRFGVSNEINGKWSAKSRPISGTGLFLHEFSHTMGMPDLYTTSSATDECQSANNQEMEYWSIMDSGCYVDNGFTPAAMTAWERWTFGWLDIETLTKNGSFELKDLDDNGKAYRIVNDNNASGNEYLVLQNIQNNKWNAKQLGHGMLVLRVDYDKTAFGVSGNSVNNILGHPRMTVIAADGLLLNMRQAENAAMMREQMAGDPFPGSGNVTSLTDEAPYTPLVYTEQPLNKSLVNITENTDTGLVTFDFINSNQPTGIGSVAISEQEDTDGRIYSIDGRFAGTDRNKLKKGIYIINNSKVVVR